LFSWNSLFDQSRGYDVLQAVWFQSLFSWNSLFDKFVYKYNPNFKKVSILVFLELALRHGG